MKLVSRPDPVHFGHGFCLLLPFDAEVWGSLLKMGLSLNLLVESLASSSYENCYSGCADGPNFSF